MKQNAQCLISWTEEGATVKRKESYSVPGDWNVFELLRVQVCHFQISSCHGWCDICWWIHTISIMNKKQIHLFIYFYMIFAHEGVSGLPLGKISVSGTCVGGSARTTWLAPNRQTQLTLFGGPVRLLDPKNISGPRPSMGEDLLKLYTSFGDCGNTIQNRL